MSSIAATFVTFNCDFLDYCIEGAIRSALNFVDEVVVNDGMSTDDTFDILLSLQKEFGKDVIKLYRRKWVHDRSWQERERNFAIDHTSCDWVLIQDADEMFHEKDAELIKKVTSDDRINLINFEVLHFYGLPFFTNPNPQWYHRHTRMGRKKVGFCIKNTPGGCVSDVCAYGHPCHTYAGSDIIHLPKTSPIYHYGWIRSADVAGIKLNKFRAWYNNDEKYFDGFLDTKVPFDYQILKYINNLDLFIGSHPAPFYKWYASKNRLIKYDPKIDTPVSYKASPLAVGMDFGFDKEETC